MQVCAASSWQRSPCSLQHGPACLLAAATASGDRPHSCGAPARPAWDTDVRHCISGRGLDLCQLEQDRSSSCEATCHVACCCCMPQLIGQSVIASMCLPASLQHGCLCSLKTVGVAVQVHCSHARLPPVGLQLCGSGRQGGLQQLHVWDCSCASSLVG